MKIAFAKFQGNWFIIDGEMDEKHALQNYQNECGPGYNVIGLIGHVYKDWCRKFQKCEPFPTRDTVTAPLFPQNRTQTQAN